MHIRMHRVKESTESSRMRGAATTAPPARGVYVRFITLGAMAAYALVLFGGVLFWASEGMRSFLSGTVLLSAALLATILCVQSWRTLSRPASTMWLILACAAGLATLSHIAQLLPLGPSRRTAIHFIWLASYAFLLAAIVYAVHESERGRLTELALDVALALTAAALVIIGWAPGAQAALTTDSAGTLFLVLFGPVVALTTLLLGAVLTTGPQTALSERPLAGIAAAIGCLVITAVPQIMTGGSCCHAGSKTVFAAIALWVFVAYAAAEAYHLGDQAMSPPTGERLRQWVAPTVAVVLAIISIDAAMNPPLGGRTALALAVLGALVALRLTELLNATRLQVVERRELAQTRALVEVSRALAGKNDLDATLRIVTHWAVRVLNARAATVELLSSDAKTLVVRATEGLPEEILGQTYPVETSFTGWVVINGEPRVTSNPQRDPFVSADTLRFIGDSSLAAMPLRYRERLLGVLSCIGNRPFDAADLDLLRAFANQTALALEDARLFEQVRALSVTDPLTGLSNRRQLDRELTREFAAAQRGRRLVAVMFDLDDFKKHNDKYGHIAGDEALRHFADALQSTTRTMNMAARYGGDEFFALLADADPHGAEIFISRVRDRFRRTMDAAGWPVLKVSAGMAEYTPEIKTPEDLVEAADRALYLAKNASAVKA